MCPAKSASMLAATRLITSYHNGHYAFLLLIPIPIGHEAPFLFHTAFLALRRAGLWPAYKQWIETRRDRKYYVAKSSFTFSRWHTDGLPRSSFE